MTPAGLVVTGMALVMLDLRMAGIDVAPDTIGWVIAIVGLWRLLPRSRWYVGAVVAAVAGAFLAVPALFAEPTGLLRSLLILTETGFVFSVCSGIVSSAGSAAGVRSTANRIRWLELALVPTALVLLMLLPSVATLVLLATVALGVAAWFMIFLLSLRDHPTLQPVAGGATRARR